MWSKSFFSLKIFDIEDFWDLQLKERSGITKPRDLIPKTEDIWCESMFNPEHCFVQEPKSLHTSLNICFPFSVSVASLKFEIRCQIRPSAGILRVPPSAAIVEERRRAKSVHQSFLPCRPCCYAHFLHDVCSAFLFLVHLGLCQTATISHFVE